MAFRDIQRFMNGYGTVWERQFFSCHKEGKDESKDKGPMPGSKQQETKSKRLLPVPENPGEKKEEYHMSFFTSSINILQKLVVAIGAGLGVWGAVNLMEGYGADNPAAKSQGIKQLGSGVGVVIIGLVLVPLLKTIFVV